VPAILECRSLTVAVLQNQYFTEPRRVIPEKIERDPRRELGGRLTTARILSFICLISLCVVLYAGLHPFHSPANQVAWVANADAVRFGEYGTILSLGSFPPPDSDGVERGIEIWVKPGKVEARFFRSSHATGCYPTSLCSRQLGQTHDSCPPFLTNGSRRPLDWSPFLRQTVSFWPGQSEKSSRLILTRQAGRGRVGLRDRPCSKQFRP